MSFKLKDRDSHKLTRKLERIAKSIRTQDDLLVFLISIPNDRSRFEIARRLKNLLPAHIASFLPIDSSDVSGPDSPSVSG